MKGCFAFAATGVPVLLLLAALPVGGCALNRAEPVRLDYEKSGLDVAHRGIMGAPGVGTPEAQIEGKERLDEIRMSGTRADDDAKPEARPAETAPASAPAGAGSDPTAPPESAPADPSAASSSH